MLPPLLSATVSVVSVAKRPAPSHSVGIYCAMLTEKPVAKASSAGRTSSGHFSSKKIFVRRQPRVLAVRISRGSIRRQAGCSTSSIHGNTHRRWLQSTAA